ncbi:TetR/AcrR family transcriptional regulator [candidate division KSB1 bacterium]|nr:TetR/AcrR family transcriptional regulator [candidate division KSB1 bacterium]RQV99934.1 MAG: TetR/AcrR family transcriptional regulator [candidate division KSB1 bacterium]
MHNHLETKNSHDTKENIFLAAAHLFAKRGYNGVSMREISEKSGVTKPTIYYYFGSKEGIYHELVDTGIQHVFSSFETILKDKMPAKDKLVVMTKKLFQFAVDYPEFAKFFMTLVTPFTDNAALVKFKKEAEKRGRILVTIIRTGIESGEFGASANPELAAKIIGGVWQHFIWQQLASQKKILTDELAQEIIEILFKGLNE